MKKIATSFLAAIVAALVLSLFTLPACGGGGGGGDKCTKAVDKGMDKGMKMIAGMADAMGEGGKKAIEDAKAEMAKKKPELIKQCQAALAKNKDLEKTLDCILGANDIESMGKCEGAQALDPANLQKPHDSNVM